MKAARLTPFFLLVLPACTAITVRPTYRPFPLAAFDTVTAKPEEVIAAASDQIDSLGLGIRVVTQAEGYLETKWFDLKARRSLSEVADVDHTIRVRVWADLVTPLQTQVIVEAALRRSLDPSALEREDAIVAPPGTAGDSLAQSLRKAIKARFPGAGTP